MINWKSIGELELDASLDFIFNQLDDLLLADKFDECNESLTAIDVESFSVAQLLTVLTATIAAKEKLSSWQEFYAKTKETLCKTQGEEKTKKLLGGFIDAFAGE